MTRFRTFLLSASAVALIASGPAHAFDGVVASIKPVHSLVAAVMAGVGEPSLIVTGAGSPHTYSMRPSEARMIEGASVVFWIGPDLEMFLRGPLETLAGNAKVVELGEADGLTVLPYREGGPFESHDHAHDHEASESGHDHSHDHESEDHAHEHADEHSHDHGHDHAHDDAHDHDHGSAHDDDDHAHGAYDTHLWLDPENAKIFVGEIETALSDADPDNAATYAQNAAATIQRLDTLIGETRTALEAVENRGFVVFHDAYQYYENRFDFPAAGSITVSPEVMPGAQRIGEIRDRIRELGVACVFSEPQFEPRLVSVVMEGTDARAGVLDPYGADLEDGPDTYFEAMTNLTTSLTRCLSGEG